ncbi:TetR/AcrR family transcriptional regulator [Murinocardiopsis flavida]|nr:TetR/AcrR family transcriptional regulator [Murinocardiopsis flavida]
MGAPAPNGDGDPRWSDLSARARIRDTALRHYAERGYAATTIRGIAAAAEVSPALVQHHFRTKDALRRACDAHVLEFIRRSTAQGVAGGGIADPGFVDAVHRQAPSLLKYLARAVGDGFPGADALFDEVAAHTERHLAAAVTEPPAPGVLRARAAVLTAMHLGVVAFGGHLSRALDVDTLSAEGLPVVGAALLDLLDPAVTGPGLDDLARQGLTTHRAAGDGAASGP